MIHKLHVGLVVTIDTIANISHTHTYTYKTSVVYCNGNLFRHLLLIFNVSLVKCNSHVYLLIGAYSFVISDIVNNSVNVHFLAVDFDVLFFVNTFLCSVCI